MATGGYNSRKSLEMEWLDLHALTKYAAVSERTIREWIHLSHNALPAVQVGKKLLVRRSDFDAWLENHRSWSGSNLFTGPGTFVWSGGTLTGTDTIAVGANLAILGAGAKTLTLGKLVNAGNGVWTGAGAVNCSYGSV